MASIARITCFHIFCVFAWLFNVAAARTCCNGDEVPNDFVLLKSLANPLPIHKAGFSQDGKLLACFCNPEGFPDFGQVVLWDISTGELVHRIKPSSEWEGVVLRSAGPIERPYYFTTIPYARLCFRTMTGLEVQDDLTKPAKRSIPLELLDGAAEIEPGRVWFSMDDEFVAMVRRDDDSIHVWSTRNGKRLQRFALPRKSTAGVRSLAFDSANRYLAVGMDHYISPSTYGAIIVWNLKSGEKVLHIDERHRVFHAVFSENGELLYGGGDGGPNGLDENGTITIRAAETFDNARTMRAPHGVISLAVVPNVGLVTGDWHGQMLLWDIQKGALLAVAKENGRQLTSLAVNQDGRLIASGGWNSVARLWKLAAVQ